MKLRNRFRLYLIVVLVLIAAFAFKAWTNGANKVLSATNTSFQTGQHGYTASDGRTYLLYLPSTYGQDPNKKWPLIVFLHGSGIILMGDDVNYIKFEALPQMLEMTPDFQFVVLSPRIFSSDIASNWLTQPAVNSIVSLINETKSNIRIDPNKISLTGFSLGGASTWNIGLQFPQMFASLVPVAAYYIAPPASSPYVPNNICTLKNIPVWAFNSTMDTLIPASAAQDLISALNACGGTSQAKITVYTSGDHNETGAKAYYNNQALYLWMLEQRLNTIGPSPGSKVGDVNHDNLINIIDIGMIIDNYGLAVNSTNSNTDVNKDGVINIIDIGIVIDNYGA